FTPWHLVFYAGFAASSAWILRLLTLRSGPLRDRIPVGYGAAVVGLMFFALGGLGDLVWHSFLGVEVGIDALLSPTHLVLMAALLAIVTAPYRAGLASGPSTQAGTIPVVSLGVGTGLVAFFVNFTWGLGDGGFRILYDPATGAGEVAVIGGIASAIVTTLVLVGAVLFLLRLGPPRVGVFTVLFGSVSLLVHVAFEEEAIGVVAALLGGVLLDLLFATRTATRFPRISIGASMAATWSVYYGLASVTDRVAWPPEIWTGAIFLCTFAAFGLACLARVSIK
ncbi:MAG: hypothetical protein ACRDGB_15495, partial [Candidatus Limnocylindria bacterium]